ncbi:YjjG family noncanonical pyrimidine nucleotidase [Epilithonimonas hispanica]|uniref:Noncanonical pyrimidine nucleotidase, YjjG family n=1 Tax=Epilithonimonas hispanica TaxID=358687 RepID=A0A3D9CZ83_9FLAO|nr:YjjG family noncanonical pyrimidine nucleotidase [Epilithonimonas hispanica]REC71044.1 noncanonical pyrimidine nucleotidase, YjjG family [Epilithonimonas hispanica]
MKNVRHIFFDLDNTLWDHRKNAYLTIKELFSQQKISEKYNIDFEEFHTTYHIINERLWEQIRDGEIDKEYLRKHRFYDTFLKFGIDDAILADYFEHHFLDEILNYNELVDGTLDLLNYLKGKSYKMHIISNGFQEVTERKCILSGISDFFETITSADSVNIRKPRPEIFQYSLDLAKAEKSESLMIGDDWIADVKGAQNFGIDVIFFDVLDENPLEEGLKFVKQLSEIKKYL